MPVVFPSGLLEDNAPLFGVTIPKEDAPIEERASKVEIKGEAVLVVAFKEPATARGLQVDRALDLIGRRVLAITERVRTEVFKV